MKQRQIDAAIFAAERLAVDLGNRAYIREELAHRMAPEHDNNFGVNGFDLIHQQGPVLFNLLWQWIAITRWPLLNNVRNKYICAVEANNLQHFIEEFTSCAHKRPA